MRNEVIRRLNIIEQEHGIKILFACESGSRGWEFPSIDSDFDVRFIYVQPVKNYLSIIQRDDHLDFDISSELDISGWDLKKVLRLTRKSNTTPLEWLQSPIFYRNDTTFRDDLWKISQGYYNQCSNIHHYLGIAKGALATVANEDEIKIKKLFYVLRPLLAAKWCLEKNNISPMNIGRLNTLLPDSLGEEVLNLIKLKSGTREDFIIKISSSLREYIDQQLSMISESTTELARPEFEPGPLDDFFIRTIHAYDH
jgi:uncharacterized protein